MTARADTEVGAANLALAHLGQPNIASLDDETIRARAVKEHFAAVRDELQRRKWWSFCKGYARPAAEVAAGLGPLATRYPMPDDCLRVRYLIDDEGEPYDAESGNWALASGTVDVAGVDTDATVIETNLTAPLVCYTRRIEAVRLWSPDFLVLFAEELASRAARKCGRSQSLADALHAGAEQKLDIASAIDSVESARKEAPRRSSWAAARSGRRQP